MNSSSSGNKHTDKRAMRTVGYEQLQQGTWLVVGFNNTAHDMDYLYNKVNVEVFKEWLLMF